MTPLGPEEIDKLFCINSGKYNLPKLLVKAVAIIESSLNPMAYRFEPLFYEKYLKDNPLYKDRDPKEVSASYGLFQLMFPTAVELGFEGTPLELYDPNYNVALGVKFIRMLLDKVISQKIVEVFYWLSPIEVALCRFNGGSYKNPSEVGVLRNPQYSTKVLAKWIELKQKEAECNGGK